MTRSLVIIWMLLLCGGAEAAGDRGRAEYAGGTVSGIPSGVNGLVRTNDKEYLVFVTKTSTLRLLYERVNLLEYGQQVSRRYALAVLISPVFVLSKARKHFLTVGYIDDEGKQQAMVFLVDKNDIRTVLATLEARTGRKVEYQDEEARKVGR